MAFSTLGDETVLALDEIRRELRLIRRALDELGNGRAADWVGEQDARRLLACGRTKFHVAYRRRLYRRRIGGRWKYRRGDIESLRDSLTESVSVMEAA